jgi:hypothetical protein
MKSIGSVIDHELTWSQASAFKNEYELRFGGELVASLRLPKMIGTMGVAESSDGSWTLERVGFWKMRTVIKANGSADELGSYRNTAWKSGGVLELPGGKKFIVWKSFWKRIFELRTEAGEPLYQLQQLTTFRVSASLRINRRALQEPELPWLVMFGFYMLVMARHDAAVHAAAS